MHCLGCPLGRVISTGSREQWVKTALAALGVLTADIYRMLRSVNRGHMQTLSVKYYQRLHESWCLMNLVTSFAAFFFFNMYFDKSLILISENKLQMLPQAIVADLD